MIPDPSPASVIIDPWRKLLTQEAEDKILRAITLALDTARRDGAREAFIDGYQIADGFNDRTGRAIAQEIRARAGALETKV